MIGYILFFVVLTVFEDIFKKFIFQKVVFPCPSPPIADVSLHFYSNIINCINWLILYGLFISIL